MAAFSGSGGQGCIDGDDLMGDVLVIRSMLCKRDCLLRKSERMESEKSKLLEGRE